MESLKGAIIKESMAWKESMTWAGHNKLNPNRTELLRLCKPNQTGPGHSMMDRPTVEKF